jgi:hypothetical protein
LAAGGQAGRKGAVSQASLPKQLTQSINQSINPMGPEKGKNYKEQFFL